VATETRLLRCPVCGADRFRKGMRSFGPTSAPHRAPSDPREEGTVLPWASEYVTATCQRCLHVLLFSPKTSMTQAEDGSIHLELPET
jgi:hypothetical protein